MYKKSIAVADLQFGMYIAELDRPWTETPFAFQGFFLQSERQLQALREFCRQVFVDVGRSDVRSIIAPAARPSATPAFAIHGNAGYTPQTELAHEIEAAGALKRHVELSAHILDITAGLPAKLGKLALLHHERQDGRGYPRGLRGYQIGLHGSSAAICDAYDALLAPPPYGEAQSPADAVKHLVRERGTVFHGPLLEQFIRCMGAFPVGSAVELTSGDYGVVVGEHVSQHLKPKVRVLLDQAGKLARSRQVIDLAVEPQIRIRRALEQGQLAFDPRRLF